MVYIILGHTFQLAGIFMAFLAAGIAFFYANTIKGGAAGKAAILNAIGFSILAVDIFLIYAGAITGQLNLLYVTLYWPMLGLLTLIGFAVIAYAQYKMYKVMK
ncbi:hypothetical protein KY342_06625 [Candidatus Woesearchaeota archaeon]|nr:hypothetical protein [Candidatus Woesearchaeota archaeon]